MLELTINQELNNYIPRPEAESYNLLKADIEVNGLKQPIEYAIIDGQAIVIDGHTRYAICQELGIAPIVLELSIKTFDEAKHYMLVTQLSRRNLNKEQFRRFIGELYNLRKAKQGGTGANQSTKQEVQCRDSENDAPILSQIDKISLSANSNTAKAIANEFGVNESTVRNAGKFVADLDKIAIVAPEAKQQLIDAKVSAKEISEIAKLPQAELKAAVAEKTSALPALSTPDLTLDDLSEAEREVLQVLEQDGIAVAKMNNWRLGKSKLERYCEQQGISQSIDRQTSWGNPFILADTKDDIKRADVITRFKAYSVIQPSITDNLGLLRGKVLFCHCYPKSCHGDVLKAMALEKFDVSALADFILEVAQDA